MTEKRQKLIDRFDKWLDSKPRKQIISAQCANIAEEYAQEQLLLHNVIKWVVCKDVKPIHGKEYLISDGQDVTEAQWYDDSEWGGEPYDSYTHYADKPKPPLMEELDLIIQDFEETCSILAITHDSPCEEMIK